MDEMDARIPNASTVWKLWYSDMFDRDFPPSLQASGENILRGLYELWLYTLKEGIEDNGSASFSYFYLTWENAASTRVDIDVKPFHNSSLLRLRRWTLLMAQDQEESSGTTEYLQERRNSVLSRLARLHYELLQRSNRWTAPAINWSAEARELLARVEGMTDSEEL